MVSFTKNGGGFNGHPPLGVNATSEGGKCRATDQEPPFQWAPTLGGECYLQSLSEEKRPPTERFNGHPPLGVNATRDAERFPSNDRRRSFNGHPPLGVNATV